MIEHLASIIATSTIVVSVASKVIGYPHQIKKIKDTRDAVPFSLIHTFLPILAYSLWFVHGILQKDIVIIISQGFGIIVSLVLFIVILKYKKWK